MAILCSLPPPVLLFCFRRAAKSGYEAALLASLIAAVCGIALVALEHWFRG